MPDVYTAGPQMLNELFNFPTGVELLGVNTDKDDGVPGSKLIPDSSTWRVFSAQQPYEYAGGFNTQKEGNLNMQSLEAMHPYLLNQANGRDYSGRASNGVIDHHPSSDHVNSIQFQLPGFSQSMASQGLYNTEHAPTGDSWQNDEGVNELLLLPTGNGNLLQNNNHCAPYRQVNNWANSSIQNNVPSSSQWCEPSPMEAKFGSGTERSVQGLSLSLSSHSQVQVQSFETNRMISSQDIVNRLQATADAKNKSADVLNGSRFYFSSSFSIPEGIYSAKRYWNPNSGSSVKFESRYVKPTQQLLEEFCNVAGNGVRGNLHSVPKFDKHQKSQWENSFGGHNIPRSGVKVEPSVSISETATGKTSNCSKDGQGNAFELRRRKAKLLWMFDEVERRYQHHSEQMKIIVTKFESAAGVGSAKIYTHLAAKAMSKHFKCLKDAIVCQIKKTNDALGEKETGVPGITKGETPRLKLIEQSLRLRRTFQSVGMFEQDLWRPQRGLPERAVTLLRAWLFEHFLHPYPSDADKHFLSRQTGLSRSQVSNWFINARVRLWKPMVEEMYQEEAKEAEMEEEDTNYSLNDAVGISDSKPDMPLKALDNSGCAMVLSTVESQDNILDRTINLNGILCKEEVTGCITTEEDNTNKVTVAGLNFCGHNGNATSNNSGNTFHQQHVTSNYFGSGDISLTLGLRHTAHQENYHNTVCLHC